MSAPRVAVTRARNGRIEQSYHRLRGAWNSPARYDLAAESPNVPAWLDLDVDAVPLEFPGWTLPVDPQPLPPCEPGDAENGAA